MFEVTIGTAFEVEADYRPTNPWVRLYRANGHTYLGYDTYEQKHFCSYCLLTFAASWATGRADTDDGYAYIAPNDPTGSAIGAELKTADVSQDFSDAPCSACGGRDD